MKTAQKATPPTYICCTSIKCLLQLLFLLYMMIFGNNLFSQDLAITVTTSNSAPIVSTKVNFTVTITHVSGGTFNNVVGYFLFDECFLWAKMPNENFDITTGNFNVPTPIGPGQSYSVTFHAIYAPDFACGTAPAQWGAKAAIISSTPTQNPTSDVSAISATAIPIGGSYAGIGTSFVPTVSSAAFPMGNSSYALKNFHIKGDILIDGSITFRDCELYIEPNVQITVLSNASLTFLNCHLYSCNTQWKGIVVEKSATLRSDNTAIEDANVAIFTKKGTLNLKETVANAVPGAADINTLESIIYQCPADGGKAVYNARALYYIAFPGKTYHDEGACGQAAGKKAKPTLSDKIKVYPNPAQNELHFEWEKPLTNNCKLTIYNAVGMLVVSQIITKQDYILSLENIDTGIYFYQLSDGNSGKFSVIE